MKDYSGLGNRTVYVPLKVPSQIGFGSHWFPISGEPLLCPLTWGYVVVVPMVPCQGGTASSSGSLGSPPLEGGTGEPTCAPKRPNQPNSRVIGKAD